MLKCCDRRKRYTSPTRQVVLCQAMGVYLYTGFLGVWGIIEAPQHWPFHSGATSGLACSLPIEVDHASSYFFWLAFPSYLREYRPYIVSSMCPMGVY